MQLKKLKLIAPDTYQEKLSDIFSKEVFYTNLDKYKQRNQSDVKKVISDIYIGKMAEFAVWNYLQRDGKDATFPDIMIYLSNKKSYDADITAGDVKIHVKSCVAMGVYPISWVFQPNDPVTINPSNKDFLALVSIEDDNSFNAYFVKAADVLQIYEKPKKEGLDKKVIYESTLLQ
jgi:hypothetical protein